MNIRSNRWEGKCINMVGRSGILILWVHKFSEGRERVYEWKVMNRSRERFKWDVRK